MTSSASALTPLIPSTSAGNASDSAASAVGSAQPSAAPQSLPVGSAVAVGGGDAEASSHYVEMKRVGSDAQTFTLDPRATPAELARVMHDFAEARKAHRVDSIDAKQPADASCWTGEKIIYNIRHYGGEVALEWFGGTAFAFGVGAMTGLGQAMESFPHVISGPFPQQQRG